MPASIAHDRAMCPQALNFNGHHHQRLTRPSVLPLAYVAVIDAIQKWPATVFKPTDVSGERPTDAPEHLLLARSPVRETLGDKCWRSASVAQASAHRSCSRWEPQLGQADRRQGQCLSPLVLASVAWISGGFWDFVAPLVSPFYIWAILSMCITLAHFLAHFQVKHIGWRICALSKCIWLWNAHLEALRRSIATSFPSLQYDY
jgi:hypothetical protein